MDEPVSALDPIGRKEIFEQIKQLKKRMTIIFSTHVLDDVERVCDKIILINRGSKIKEGSINDIQKNYVKNILEIVFTNDKALTYFVNNFKMGKVQTEVVADELKVFISGEDLSLVIKKVFQFLLDNDIKIESLIVKKPTLEEIFVKEVVA